MYKSKSLLMSVAALTALTLWGLPNASAQSLYVTADRTVAGGNPVNGNFSLVQIGTDIDLKAYPNVSVDITGGTITQYVNALYGSTVNISGGTIGTAPANGVAYTAVNIASGSTVNMTGGTLLSLVDVRGSNAGALNRFNLSGGAVNGFILNENDGIVQISGGTVGDFIANYGTGTINVTGGSLTSLSGFDFSGSGGGTINFGGTATVNSIASFGGVANITGGTVGAGGVTVRGTGTANVTGSGLTVNQVSTGAFFDDSNYVNVIVSQYTLTGTLTSGAAVSTTVSAGESFSNNGSTATFNAPVLAPDLYVTTDQTVTGVYNNINVGIDETLSVPSNPTATVAAGTDTVFLTTYSNSVTHMTGGIVRGFVLVGEQSNFTMSGGEAPGGIGGAPGTTVVISGGATSYLEVAGTATVSGGAVDYVQLDSGGTLIVQGSGLSTTGTAGHYWDPNSGTNYINGGSFEVIGTLADGSPFDQTVIASGATGTVSQQTIVGPQAASDLYATSDTTTGTIYNVVTIGANADGTVNTSPTVAFGAGSDVGNVYVRNQSRLNIGDGLVNGTIYASKDVTLNITGGTVGRVYQSTAGAGMITVSGGNTTYIAPAGHILVTAGTLGTLDTYGGAQVRIDGGDVAKMLLYGGSAKNPTNVLITGGTIGIIDYKGSGNVTTILGGSVAEIWGAGGSAYIYGGLIGADSLLNYRTNATLFDIFGENLLLSNAALGTYTDNFGTKYDGVWWNVTGTLNSGTPLSTRYFERGGSLGGPVSLVFNVVVPEPGTLGLLAGLPAMGLVRRRRSFQARTSG